MPAHARHPSQVADPYGITFLRPRDGVVLCKFHFATHEGVKTEPYSRAWVFQVITGKIRGFDHFAEVLETATKANVAAIRGEPYPETNLDRTRRLLHPDVERGHPAAFYSTPRCWVQFDWDGTAPDGAPDLVAEPAAAARALLQSFPVPLHEVTCWWSLGNSAGVVPGKFSLHFWYLIDRPVEDGDVQAFCRLLGFDPALGHAIQLHYLSPPAFFYMSDPCQVRHGIHRGKRDALDGSWLLEAGEAKRRFQKPMKSRLEMGEEQAIHAPDTIIRSSVDAGRGRATVADLMAGPYHYLIQAEESSGWVACDCPRHASSSGLSFRINVMSGQWHCFGCAEGGGTAWDLAHFVRNGNRAAVLHDLRIARGARHE